MELCQYFIQKSQTGNNQNVSHKILEHQNKRQVQPPFPAKALVMDPNAQ